MNFFHSLSRGWKDSTSSEYQTSDGTLVRRGVICTIYAPRYIRGTLSPHHGTCISTLSRYLLNEHAEVSYTYCTTSSTLYESIVTVRCLQRSCHPRQHFESDMFLGRPLWAICNARNHTSPNVRAAEEKGTLEGAQDAIPPRI